MPSPTRFLNTPDSSALTSAAIDSDLIIILVSLLCALICVVGLALVARCSRPRPSSSSASSAGSGAAASSSSSSVSARLLPAAAAADRGLKKKILRNLPTLSFEAPAGGGVTECPICLAEFAERDRIRLLPHCGHAFHVGCIDTWLGSHSSCPSCRRILAPPAPAAPSSAAAAVLQDSRT